MPADPQYYDQQIFIVVQHWQFSSCLAVLVDKHNFIIHLRNVNQNHNGKLPNIHHNGLCPLKDMYEYVHCHFIHKIIAKNKNNQNCINNKINKWNTIQY